MASPTRRRRGTRETPFDALPLLAEAQRLSDERLIAWCDHANDVALDAIVDMDRGSFIQRDRARDVLLHLFMHQVHHRGQAHAMLSGTPVKPPQLDEFVMPSDAKFRVEDMRALGWREDEIYAR